MTFFFCFFGLRLILGGKLDVGRCEDLFFGLHLILGGKLDVGRREDLSFWSSPIFFVETETRNCASPPFQISGHAPGEEHKFCKPMRSTCLFATKSINQFFYC